VPHAFAQEVTNREDSESYAKRTISEIESCLGFSFHGGGGSPAAPDEDAPEAISNTELKVRCSPQAISCGCVRTPWRARTHALPLSGMRGTQVLNTQVEAALQSGLNFKARFTTNSRRRLLLVEAAEDADEADDEGGGAGAPPTCVACPSAWPRNGSHRAGIHNTWLWLLRSRRHKQCTGARSAGCLCACTAAAAARAAAPPPPAT
jgi:hypothetical protein